MIYTLGDRRMETAGDDWYVAPTAQVIGSVRLGHGASVWFGAVIRGDTDWIVLGDRTNVQDGSVLHTDEGVPLVLGSGVTVGHAAFLHGCAVGDDSMIANGAMVLDGARVGSHCIIAAGAMVPPGKVIPDRSVVMGAPGKVVREVTERDLQRIRFACSQYLKRGALYRQGLAVDARSDRAGASPGT